MSRFAADPRWLVYLPPTMSPTATTDARRPARAPGGGVRRVPTRRRQTGSCARRSTWARVPSSSSAATPKSPQRRFGVADERGRRHRSSPAPADRSSTTLPTETSTLLDKVRAADRPPSTCGSELATDWLVLDAELLPWSAKAEELLRRQYASVGAAATATLRAEAARPRGRAATRGVDVGELLGRTDRAARHGRPVRRRLPPVLLAGRRRSTTSASRRSRSWPARARSTP